EEHLVEVALQRHLPGGEAGAARARNARAVQHGEERCDVDALGGPIVEVDRLSRQHRGDGRTLAAQICVALGAAHPGQYLTYRSRVFGRRIASRGNTVGDTYPARGTYRQHRDAPVERGVA